MNPEVAAVVQERVNLLPGDLWQVLTSTGASSRYVAGYAVAIRHVHARVSKDAAAWECGFSQDRISWLNAELNITCVLVQNEICGNQSIVERRSERFTLVGCLIAPRTWLLHCRSSLSDMKRG
jgi:hypothetical protein